MGRKSVSGELHDAPSKLGLGRRQVGLLSGQVGLGTLAGIAQPPAIPSVRQHRLGPSHISWIPWSTWSAFCNLFPRSALLRSSDGCG